MGLLDFMAARPLLTFFLAAMVYGVIQSVLYLARQPIRSANIRAQGWPPAHLDADGDYMSKTARKTTEVTDA